MNCWHARRMHQDTDRSSSVAMRSSAVTMSSSIRSPRARSCVFFLAMRRCSYIPSCLSRIIAKRITTGDNSYSLTHCKHGCLQLHTTHIRGIAFDDRRIPLHVDLIAQDLSIDDAAVRFEFALAKDGNEHRFFRSLLKCV